MSGNLAAIEVIGEVVEFTEISFDKCPKKIRDQVITGLQVIIMETIGEGAASPDLTRNCFYITNSTVELLTALKTKIDAFLKTLPGSGEEVPELPAGAFEPLS